MRTVRAVVFLITVSATIEVSSPVLAQDGSPMVRGIVRAVDEAWISTDLDTRINSLPFREGQSFNAGDVLATFDCGDLRAQAKAAEAVLRAEQLTSDNNAKLAKMNAAGKYEVELAAAKRDQAAAEMEVFLSKLSRCSIEAPFAGRVSSLRANAYEFPDKSAPLMQIVGEINLEIDILLPGAWLRWLKPHTPFGIFIEETGLSFHAEVTRTAAVVDAVSQTVKVTGRFVGNHDDILPGMSGPAKFVVPHG